MGNSPEGSALPQDADEPSESSAQRGLFGRLLTRLSGTEPPRRAADHAGEAAAAALHSHALGVLRRLRVDDIAVPKAEIRAVPVTIGFDDLITAFRDSGFSRLPVYEGSLDRPLGLVHLKDIALEQFCGEPRPPYDLRKVLRPLIYVPPSMPIGVLLQKMQSARTHMALMIDEYGGVDGLVTLEDVVEQVVGEIEDEHDTDEDSGLWVLERPGQYIVQARAPLDEFEEAIGLRLADEEEDEEVDTVGGFVFMLTGRVPARGERVFHPSGVEFEVLDADKRRIKRLRVRLPEEAEGAGLDAGGPGGARTAP